MIPGSAEDDDKAAAAAAAALAPPPPPTPPFAVVNSEQQDAEASGVEGDAVGLLSPATYVRVKCDRCRDDVQLRHSEISGDRNRVLRTSSAAAAPLLLLLPPPPPPPPTRNDALGRLCAVLQKAPVVVVVVAISSSGNRESMASIARQESIRARENVLRSEKKGRALVELYFIALK